MSLFTQRDAKEDVKGDRWESAIVPFYADWKEQIKAD